MYLITFAPALEPIIHGEKVSQDGGGGALRTSRDDVYVRIYRKEREIELVESELFGSLKGR